MSKKKAAKAPKSAAAPAREPRKEPYNVARFAIVIDRMKELTAKVDAISKALKESKIDEVDVDGHQMLLRAFTQIENFADNSARSVREARNALRKF